MTITDWISSAFWFGAYSVPTVISLGAVALYYFQDKLLYYPSIPPGARKDFIPPSHFGLEEHLEEIFMTTLDGEKIHSWFFKQQLSKKIKYCNIFSW